MGDGRHVFVFGAGASQGAQTNANASNKPPLSNELCNVEYAGWATQMGLALPELAAFRESVQKAPSLEKWLTDKWNAIDTYTHPLKRQSERSQIGRFTFYIWRVLLHVSDCQDQYNEYYPLVQ